MATTRTDVHRPGALVPAQYRHVLSYNTSTSQDGWPIPSYGVNCELDRRVYDEKGTLVKNGEHDPDGRCCVVGLRRSGARFVETGGTGQCSVCSTHFVYGDVQEYVPTGDLLHVGHNCADKYALLTDRSAWELAHDRAKQAAAVQVQKKLNAEARAAFLARHDGLAEALTLDHPILRDLSEKLTKWHTLSEKQVAFALKLADEVRHPKAVEPTVAAPLGDGVTVTGTVVSTKIVESSYGTQLRMVVKVTTPEGVWLVSSTVPSFLLDRVGQQELKALRGQEVTFVANLIPFDTDPKPYFVLGKRPRAPKAPKPVKASKRTAKTPAPEAAPVEGHAVHTHADDPARGDLCEVCE